MDIQQVTTRLVAPEDEERLTHMWARLSPQTRYQRFHAAVGSPPEESAHDLVAADHRTREAVVALAGEEIVGVVGYERDRDDPARAEFAVVVEDDWQGRGLGGRLLGELIALARERGVGTLVGMFLMDNQRMLRLVRRHVPDAAIHHHDGEYEVEIGLAGPAPGGGGAAAPE